MLSTPAGDIEIAFAGLIGAAQNHVVDLFGSGQVMTKPEAPAQNEGRRTAPTNLAI